MKDKQTQLQIYTIGEVVSVLKKYNSVVAAALMGSHADGTNTAFSDIDLVVVFQNDERTGLESIFKEIISLKPTLCTLYQLYDKESLILFEDGVRLDLTLEKRSDFDKWTLKLVKVLFDNEGILNQMVKASLGKTDTSNKPKWNDKEGVFIDWFFWMFRQAYCYACQSEIVSGKSFEKIDLALSSVKSIRDKLLEVLYYTNGKRDYLINIDEKILLRFSQTYPSNSADEIKSSIRTLAELYEIIIGKYCVKEGIEFPDKKVRQIKKLFIEFDKLTNFPIHP